MGKDFIDKVLVSAKRTYEKDEIMMALYKKISDGEFRIGELTSERDELRYNLDKALDELDRIKRGSYYREITKGIKEQAMYQEQMRKMAELRKSNKDLREARDIAYSKMFNNNKK